MGESKRKKSSDGGDLNAAKLLAEAYASGDWKRLKTTFDDLVGDPACMKTFNAAVDFLPKTEWYRFSAGLHLMACKVDAPPELGGRCDMFTLVFSGTESQFEQLTNGRILDELSGLIKTSGFAHPASNVILAPVGLDLVKADAATPFAVRAATLGLLAAAKTTSGRVSP